MATAGGLEIHLQLAHMPDSPPIQGEPVPAVAGVGPAVSTATAPAAVALADVDDIIPLDEPRRKSKLTAVPVIALAIVALLVAGVASALVRNNEGASNPLAMMQAAAATTSNAGTAQVAATIKSTSGPLANGVSVDGGFDFNNHRASLDADPSKF